MTKVREKQNNFVTTVTRDSGANVKLLRRLEREGYIKIFDVKFENGRENKKVKEKVLPVGVWGSGARWGECVWAGADCVYADIREILGKEYAQDAMQLEAHIRNGHDYFVTEDNDFLRNRSRLEDKFSVKIVTPEELQEICQK